MGKLFIVTATHVVVDTLEAKQAVYLKFFDDYRSYQASVIRNFPDKDIALPVVKKPSSFTWQPNCLGNASVGTDVAFIGREGDWYVPLGRALGTVYDLDNNQIQVDITSVTMGTSGAPLISNSGMVGMIVEAGMSKVTAVDLTELRRTLSEYSYFFSLSGASGTSTNSNNTSLSNPDLITDRDGNSYATKIMKDGKRWMTKNLNIKVDDSWCYEDKTSNCNEYGRLYTFEAAKEGCRLLGNGWRLPTDEEWREMAKQYGGADDDANDGGKVAFKALFGNGSRGFAAQLGGWRNISFFYFLGTNGAYWSSTPHGEIGAWHYSFDRFYGKLYRLRNNRGNGHSVRCLQDK